MRIRVEVDSADSSMGSLRYKLKYIHYDKEVLSLDEEEIGLIESCIASPEGSILDMSEHENEQLKGILEKNEIHESMKRAKYREDNPPSSSSWVWKVVVVGIVAIIIAAKSSG